MTNEKEVCFNTYKSLPYKSDLSGCDYAVAGIEFDSAAGGEPGTRFAPDVMRRASFPLQYNQILEIDSNLVTGTDYGNIPVKSGYILPSFHMITDGMKELLKGGVIPIIIGGDHSITLPELRAYKEFYGPVGLIHFDSHRDVRCSGTKYDHGTPFSRALEEGLFDPKHAIQIGMRASYHSPEYANFGVKEGMKIITADELHEMGEDKCIKQIIEQVGNVPCIITFDIDFLDPTAAPGTGTPVVGGFETYTARKIIRGIGSKLNVVGFDMVEVSPDIDVSGITCAAADGIIVDFIGTLAKRKSEGKLTRCSGVSLEPDLPEKTLAIEKANIESSEHVCGQWKPKLPTMLGFDYSTDPDVLKEADVVVFGMPYDNSTSNRPGTKFAPKSIRKFRRMGGYHETLHFSPSENFKGIDYGDFIIGNNSAQQSMMQVTTQLKTILDSTDAVTIGLGGDHTLTFAELRAMKEKYGPMAFIHFDSHTDTWKSPDEDGNCRINHGTPFRLAIENGSLDATHGIQIGMRSGGMRDGIHDHEWALSKGMTIIKACELHDMSLEECAKKIREVVENKPVFVTFDIDFLDPAYAPGTGTPVIGGFTTYEAIKLLRLCLPGLNIKGMDIVEVSPPYDRGTVTSQAGAAIVSEYVTCLSYTKNVLNQKTTS